MTHYSLKTKRHKFICCIIGLIIVGLFHKSIDYMYSTPKVLTYYKSLNLKKK